MSELLSCPFCGGAAHTYHNNLWHVGCENALNGCVTMSAFVTEDEAIDAWNTRAERTCHDRSVDSSEQFYCSECECTVDMPLLWGELNYCPGCGRKVEQ